MADPVAPTPGAALAAAPLDTAEGGPVMPDVVAQGLTAEEIANRREAMRDAIASARIEGLAVSDGARAVMDLHAQGRIGADEMIARIRRLHVGP